MFIWIVFYSVLLFLVLDGDQFILIPSQVPKRIDNVILLPDFSVLNRLKCSGMYFSCVSFLLQMHHPIQMKPADSENRNGE